MAVVQEIEDRYLLTDMPALDNAQSSSLIQGYLFKAFERTKRVRIVDDKQAFITIKGSKVGLSAPEEEWEISVEEARALLAECDDEVILSKTRHSWPSPEKLVWEIDEFHGRLSGLFIAEIELPSEDTPYKIPAWLKGVKITTDRRFANAKLVDMDRQELVDIVRSVLEPAGLSALRL